MNSTRLGPVGDPYTVSPSGSGPLFFSEPRRATIYTIASTGAMLLYRAETRQRRNAALAAEPRCVPDSNCTRMVSAYHTIRSHQFLSDTTTPTGWGLLLSPEPRLVGTTEVYSGLAADIVLESLLSSAGQMRVSILAVHLHNRSGAFLTCLPKPAT